MTEKEFEGQMARIGSIYGRLDNEVAKKEYRDKFMGLPFDYFREMCDLILDTHKPEFVRFPLLAVFYEAQRIVLEKRKTLKLNKNPPETAEETIPAGYAIKCFQDGLVKHFSIKGEKAPEITQKGNL